MNQCINTEVYYIHYEINPDFSSFVKKSEAQYNEIDQEFSSFAEESET